MDGSSKLIDVSGNISQFTSDYGIVRGFTIDTKETYYLASYSNIASISSKATHSWLISNLESPPSDLKCDSKVNVCAGNLNNSICKTTLA